MCRSMLAGVGPSTLGVHMEGAAVDIRGHTYMLCERRRRPTPYGATSLPEPRIYEFFGLA